MKIKEILNALAIPAHSAPGAPQDRKASDREAERLTRANRQRDNEDIQREMGGPETWMTVPAALSGIALIARICASTPVSLRRRGKDGKWQTIAPGSQGDGVFARLLLRPNRHQSPYQFWNTLYSQIKAHGNAYVLIKERGKGENKMRELWILNSNNIEARYNAIWEKEYRYRHSSVNNEGWVQGKPGRRGGKGEKWVIADDKRAYRSSHSGGVALPIPGMDARAGGKGEVILRDEEVIHITDHSMDPLVGVNIAAQYARTYGLAAAIEVIASEYASNGGRPPILVFAKNPNVGDDKLEDARNELANMPIGVSGITVASGDFGVAVLGGGMDGMDDTRIGNIRDIMRGTGVPTTHSGLEDSSASSKSAEEMSRVFYHTCIQPLQKAVGDAMRDGLSPNWHTQASPVEVYFDNKQFQMGSLIAQSQHLEGMVGNRVYTRNEARAMLGLEPVEGGDEFDDPMMLQANRGGRPNTDSQERSDTERQRNRDNGRSRRRDG